jgi:uncharacterized membrane protein
MELLVSYVLRIGVLLGTAIIVAGVVQMARTGQTGYASVLPSPANHTRSSRSESWC